MRVSDGVLCLGCGRDQWNYLYLVCILTLQSLDGAVKESSLKLLTVAGRFYPTPKTQLCRAQLVEIVFSCIVICLLVLDTVLAKQKTREH